MREDFERALREDRFDELSHRAFADWLEENGFDDEALIHRNWDADEQRESEAWLEEFAKSISYEDDEDGYGKTVTREDLVAAARMGGWIGFPYQTPDRCHRDRAEFEKHLAIVMWVSRENVPHVSFSCSC